MPDRFRPKPFHCAVEDAGADTAYIRPSGELDMATVAEFEARFQEAHEAGFRRLVADLRQLDFIDSTGLTLLARWSLGAERDGYDFAVIPGSDRTRQLFDLTGLTPHFRLQED